jgi:F-type H+-transporting ATPase subunit alpha
LDLAQYRELAAFSQFASDLDAETKARLDKWIRMMELLKQWVYSPVPVEKQVCVIYAWSNGYLKDIEVAKVGKFENDLYSALDTEKTVLETIKNEKVLTDEAEEKLKKIIDDVVEMNV